MGFAKQMPDVEKGATKVFIYNSVNVIIDDPLLQFNVIKMKSSLYLHNCSM